MEKLTSKIEVRAALIALIAKTLQEAKEEYSNCDFQSATESLALVRVVHLEISRIQLETTEMPSELNILLAAKQIIFRALADFDTPTMHTTVEQNGLLYLSPLTISLHTSEACAPMQQ